MNVNIEIIDSHLSGPTHPIDFKIFEAQKAVAHFATRLIEGYDNVADNAKLLALYAEKLAALMLERNA